MDITRWRGIPVTTPAHTILDLAATLRSDHGFGRVVHEAEVQGRTHPEPFVMNTTVPGLPTWIEVDFLFPAQRVVIEADRARFHDTQIRQARDWRKQAILEAAGLQVIRLRHEDVEPPLEPQTGARVTNALSPPAPIRTEAPRAR